MSTCKISGDHTAENKGNNTAEKPYVITNDDGFADIQTINLENRYAELPKFERHTNIVSVEGGKITNTNGNDMFAECTSLTTFSSDLSDLMESNYMFWGCTSLKSFTSGLKSLKSGGAMFFGCTSLSSFSGDLGSLTNGWKMFYGCTSLTTFSSNLSNLTKGSLMFHRCSSLQSVRIKCKKWNKSLMTKSNLSIRQEATLEVSTDNGATWEEVDA